MSPRYAGRAKRKDSVVVNTVVHEVRYVNFPSTSHAAVGSHSFSFECGGDLRPTTAAASSRHFSKVDARHNGRIDQRRRPYISCGQHTTAASLLRATRQHNDTLCRLPGKLSGAAATTHSVVAAQEHGPTSSPFSPHFAIYLYFI